jgi:hypothetical protein
MGELMQAITDGRPPQTSGPDNLSSIAIALAAVRSSEIGEAVEVEPQR